MLIWFEHFQVERFKILKPCKPVMNRFETIEFWTIQKLVAGLIFVFGRGESKKDGRTLYETRGIRGQR